MVRIRQAQVHIYLTPVHNRLGRLPHVIAVFLKRTRAQIEVVVTNCEEALDASPELREEHFDVVNFVGMHLMWNPLDIGECAFQLCGQLDFESEVTAQNDIQGQFW